MSFTVLPAASPERESLHHRARARTALALALALAPSAALGCPQCAADAPSTDPLPVALAALALAPIGLMAAGALWIVRGAHRRAEVE